MMQSKIKIGLADDEILIREGLKNILKSETNIELLFDVSNGKELIDQLSNSIILPDIILMDINMPEMNGVDATKVIFNKYSSISIIALSSYSSEIFIKKMFSVGAVCYISKTITPDELIKRINLVYDKGFYYESSMLKFIEILNKNATKTEVSLLSEREIEILKLICLQKSSLEMADLLNISNRTVDGHRNSL